MNEVHQHFDKIGLQHRKRAPKTWLLLRTPKHHEMLTIITRKILLGDYAVKLYSATLHKQD